MAALAARLPTPIAVPLAERPLEQDPQEDLAALASLLPHAAAAVDVGERTPGELLLSDAIAPLPADTAAPVEATDAASTPPLPAVVAVSSPPLPPSPPTRRGRHHTRPPPAPPRPREVPLLGNLTTIAAGGTRYVRTHVGLEAACALFFAALLSLLAVGYVVRAFCDYSLCCFSRGVKRAKLTSPRAEFA